MPMLEGLIFYMGAKSGQYVHSDIHVRNATPDLYVGQFCIHSFIIEALSTPDLLTKKTKTLLLLDSCNTAEN